MGGSKKPSTGYGPNAGQSGSDPRGRSQNQSQYQQQRYEQQQGPLANQAALNYGRASEAQWGDYNDIMGQYRNIAGGGGPGGGSGGGGGGGYSVQGKYTPFLASYSDPFESYAGFKEFSKTGGYSAEDMANLRARGVSPIRAAYANAEREIGRQRSLQGGYSPNAISAQTRMAREQGQAAADAAQGVEAGIVNDRNQGKLAGLGGMSGIEGQRLGAQIDVSKFNAGARSQAQSQNLSAAERAAASRASARQASSAMANANQMNALQEMRLLYGTTPGMAGKFGDQAIALAGQGGEFGLNLMGRENEGQRLPGAFDQNYGRFRDIYNDASTIAYPWLDEKYGGGKQSGTGSRYPNSSVPYNRQGN